MAKLPSINQSSCSSKSILIQTDQNMKIKMYFFNTNLGDLNSLYEFNQWKSCSRLIKI
jgi:hypothetical protein